MMNAFYISLNYNDIINYIFNLLTDFQKSFERDREKTIKLHLR